MSKIKSEMATRCELALMGKVIPVNSNDEVQEMTEYIMSAMDYECVDDPDFNLDVMKRINEYQANEVKYLVCNTIHGMSCITYLLDSGVDKEDESYYPAPFETDYGTGYPVAFSYVLNLDSEWCSEFGDAFFQKKADGYYHRVS